MEFAILVIGDRNMEAGAVAVRLRSKGNPGAKPKSEVAPDILAAIKERRPRADGARSIAPRKSTNGTETRKAMLRAQIRALALTLALALAEQCSALRYCGRFSSRVRGSRNRALLNCHSSGVRQRFAFTGLFST
jgi:hypothetical protein